MILTSFPCHTPSWFLQEADADKKTASFYVEMMKNVVKEGNGAVAKATKAIEEEAGDDKDWKQNVLASLTKYRCKSGHTGCLKAMDAVAETFLAASVEERAGLLKKVQALDFSKDEADQESAKVCCGAICVVWYLCIVVSYLLEVSQV